MVTAGKRTTISDILAFNRIDNLDTVAGTIDVLATPTAYLDVATNTADMVYTCAHDTAYAHTYANGTLQPCPDGPTPTYVVAQRKREGRKEGQEGQVWKRWQEIGTARPSVPRYWSRPSNHRRRQ